MERTLLAPSEEVRWGVPETLPYGAPTKGSTLPAVPRGDSARRSSRATVPARRELPLRRRRHQPRAAWSRRRRRPGSSSSRRSSTSGPCGATRSSARHYYVDTRTLAGCFTGFFFHRARSKPGRGRRRPRRAGRPRRSTRRPWPATARVFALLEEDFDLADSGVAPVTVAAYPRPRGRQRGPAAGSRTSSSFRARPSPDHVFARSTTSSSRPLHATAQAGGRSSTSRSRTSGTVRAARCRPATSTRTPPRSSPRPVG